MQWCWLLFGATVVLAIVSVVATIFYIRHRLIRYLFNDDLYICGGMGDEDYSALANQLMRANEFMARIGALRAFDKTVGLFLVQANMINYASVCSNPLTMDRAVFANAQPIDGRLDGEQRFGYAWAVPPSNGRVVVLVFRGTLSMEDWMTDLNFRQTEPSFLETPGAQLVHTGFDTLYATMRDNVYAALEGAFPNAERVFVTGHSLGGALATLCAMDLASNTKHKVICYTYGSPRVGNVRFAEAYQAALPNSVRVWNRYDTIPDLPAAGLAGTTYQHVQPAQEVVQGPYDNMSGNHSPTTYYLGMQRM